MIEAADLELRPARPGDRAAVAELAGPGEQVPFDDWVETPAGEFWAAEWLGRIVAVVRVRSIAEGIFHVDGLLVDRGSRRQGIGSALLERTLDTVRAQGGRRLRAEALDDAARALARRAGFRTVAEAELWRGVRLEGGEPARLASDHDLAGLVEVAQGDRELASTGHRLLAPGEARDLDEASLRERVDAGAIRLAAGARAYAVAVEEEPRIVVAAVVGLPSLWPELLEQLRFEADLHDLPGVDVWLPPGHPAGTALEGVAYHREDAPRLSSLELDV